MKVRAFLCFLIIFAATLSLIACGGNEQILYTVTFDTDGGSSVEAIEVEMGSKLQAPNAPTKEGYEFVGWYNGDAEWNFEKNTVSDNILLTARWKKIHTVSYFNGDTLINTVTVKDGAKLEKPADPEKSGFLFLGWHIGENPWIFDVNTVTSDITLTAQWQAISEIPVDCTVKFDTTGGVGGEDTADRTVSAGSIITKPHDPKKEGFKFVGWFVGEKEWNFESDIVTEDLTVSARWMEYFTVSFDTDGGSNVKSKEVLDGEICTMPKAPTKDGYEFDGWFFEGAQWNFDTPITEDITLSAKWKEYFTVSFDTDGGSEVEPKSALDGTSVTAPTAPKKAGFVFIGWFFGDAEWNFEAPITAHITLIAKWREAITVRFDTDGGSEIEPQELLEGDTITAPTAPTKAGYAFEGWFYGDVEWDFETPVTEDITLSAKWLECFTVSFNTDGGNEIASQIIADGSLLTAPEAPMKENHKFIGWFVGDTEWDFTTPITSDIELTAKWVMAHKVTFRTAQGSFTVMVEDGKTVERPENPVQNGLVFENWLTASGAVFDFNTPITEDITLSAKWKINGGGTPLPGDKL